MRIAITGSSGLVGRAATDALVERGDTVVPVRRGRTDPDRELRWDPNRGFDPPDALSGFDAVIHLAGESIASGRWTEARKEKIRRSRVEGTRRVVEAMKQAEPHPEILVCASGIDYYGDTGEKVVDEEAPAGEGFLADVCRAWEAEAMEAEALPGVRVVRLRFAMILGRGGGALPRLLPVFRFGLGGRLGDGRQTMTWVHIDDVVGAILHVLDRPDARGAYNVVAPDLADNRRFTAAMGAALHRPAVLAVPPFALRLAYGEMADATLLAGHRARPAHLEAEGFRFSFATLESALDDLLAED